jgi:hypothetical protein
MRAFEVRKPYHRLLTLHELGHNEAGEVGLYRVLGYTEKYVALQDTYGRALCGVVELVITEKHKVPLYKQAMAMQMGKKPKTTTQTQRILKLQQIEPMNVKYDMYIATL